MVVAWMKMAAQEMEVATLGLQCEGCINRTC